MSEVDKKKKEEKEVIRSQQEANKNLSQEEKQALRKAKKAEKAQKALEKKQNTANEAKNSIKTDEKSTLPPSKVTTTPVKTEENKKRAPNATLSKREEQTPTRSKKEEKNSKPVNRKNGGKETPTSDALFVKRLFSHLPVYEGSSSQKCKYNFSSHHVIHPLFLQLGLMMGNREITGANKRGERMLEAFKELLSSFPIKKENGKTHYLDDLCECVNLHYAFLCNQRAPSIPMQVLYESIKSIITQSDRNESYETIRLNVLTEVDKLMERLRGNKMNLVKQLKLQIQNDDVIITFGESERITDAFLQLSPLVSPSAPHFRVIIIGGRPKNNKENMLRRLVQQKIPCSFAPINALPYVLEAATKAVVSVSAMLGNGAAIADIGTAVVATACKMYNVPLLVSADTLKFTSMVQLDSISKNEINNPNSFRPTLLPSVEEKTYTKKWILQDYTSMENLQLLNLSYDLIPASLITGVVTEMSVIPPSSVPSILHEYENDYLQRTNVE